MVTVKNMAYRVYPAILTVLLAGGPTGADALSGKNNKGNGLFAEGKYEEALKMYRDAQIESPEDARLHYNIGNTLYRKKKFDDAAAAYEKALATDDAALQQQAYYNMGNSLYRAGDDMIAQGQQEGVEKMKQAIESYKKALEIDAADTDAKFNIEFVQNKLKELAQNNQDNQQQNQQQQQKQQQQQGQENQQNKDKQDQQQQQQGKDKEEQEQQPQQAQEKKAGEMSEEEAKRLLDALKDEEKDLQKKLRRMPGKRGRVVKDW